MTSDDTAGFVVVEFNQASHQPGVPYTDVYRYRYEAEEYAAERREKTRQIGRRERFAVAEVVLLEEPE